MSASKNTVSTCSKYYNTLKKKKLADKNVLAKYRIRNQKVWIQVEMKKRVICCIRVLNSFVTITASAK